MLFGNDGDTIRERIIYKRKILENSYRYYKMGIFKFRYFKDLKKSYL